MDATVVDGVPQERRKELLDKVDEANRLLVANSFDMETESSSFPQVEPEKSSRKIIFLKAELEFAWKQFQSTSYDHKLLGYP
ncbi:hypothetical protein E2562_028685 [Oryza meyeriana var. granulata]|uniref:Uncharacterized protein n=1 Tax=Oryza meyeriana var. granulata TaxID=110450 RepID=A0A6G1BP89_9ORYZ|nr:hypothetical protein E2562_028685 [Oryza meyeriana var. granulata]